MEVPGAVADLWVSEDGKVKCTACARYCRLREGQVGLCGIRGAHGGRLYLYVYGRIIASHVDPIEKKPVTHFMPGTKIFSIATTGCNWLCHPAGTGILMSDGSIKRVEEVVPGDVLWSYDVHGGMVAKPSVVTHVGSRKARLLEVRYGGEEGRSILLTEEHPVLTLEGWKTAAELRSGDYMIEVLSHGISKWQGVRGVSGNHAIFHCRVCGSVVRGIEEWNLHRRSCYVHGSEKSLRGVEAAGLRAPKEGYKRSQEKSQDELGDRVDHVIDEHRCVEKLVDSNDVRPAWTRLKLYEILDELGINYQSGYEINLSRSRPCYIADAAIPEAGLVIEVKDSLEFHNGKASAKDPAVYDSLRADGWDVVSIWEGYLYNHPEEVKQLILTRAMRQIMVDRARLVAVKGVRQLDRLETVYSIECIPHHNYIADGILVHNCQYCQNFDISQRRKVEGLEVTPKMVVEHALKYGSHGIAYTYNEPTIFMEFARDVGLEAKGRGLFNIFVTNGYWTPESVAMAATFLDAATVDFKGNGERDFVRRYIGIPDVEPIFQTLLEMRDKTKIHIEITDLVVPEIGDDLSAARRLVRWIYDNLGPDTPIHFLRFHPDYKLMHLPWTPIETLEAHWRVAREEGMKYVYIGNVPGHPYEHTYCPGCGQVVVERIGFDIVGWKLGGDNRCPQCGYKVAIIGRPPSGFTTRRRFIPVQWQTG